MLTFQKWQPLYQKKLQGAVKDSTVSFSLSPFESKITISFSKTLNPKASCEGALIITIKSGNNLKPKPKPNLQSAYNPEAVQKATRQLLLEVPLLLELSFYSKFLIGALGCAVGRPVGCLVGVAS